MRFLFVKSRLEWPRTYGHDVHCYELMRALADLGHDIALATDTAPSERALEGLPLSARWVLRDAPASATVQMSYLQERFRSYWGIPHERIAALGQHASEWRADVVVVVGLEILPYLAGVAGPLRVWYAADEWVWHYLSQLATDPGDAVTHLRQAAIKGVYERAFGPLMDRVWVVSKTERRAMKIVAGCRNVDVLPNGVDTDTFRPVAIDPVPQSAVFWGRLGFGPNLQALRWFCGKVWPIVRQTAPEATFLILGADPPPEVAAFNGRDGIQVLANLDDLRPDISRAEIAVLPFVSGGGIKNKLLEAASMSRPIVATSRATTGLRSAPPFPVADSPAEFASSILRLWNDAAARAALGAAAREWVLQHHSWTATAREAVESVVRPS